MSNQENKTASEILNDVSNEIFDVECIPTLPEAKVILDEEGIDVKPTYEWTLSKIEGIRARQKLAGARSKRLSLLAMIDECKESVLRRGKVVREAVIEKLNELGEVSPEKAQAYCHRFEEASEEDLVDIEVELMMLDLHSEEFGDEHD
jgi:hypothetical protein